MRLTSNLSENVENVNKNVQIRNKSWWNFVQFGSSAVDISVSRTRVHFFFVITISNFKIHIIMFQMPSAHFPNIRLCIQNRFLCLRWKINMKTRKNFLTSSPLSTRRWSCLFVLSLITFSPFLFVLLLTTESFSVDVEWERIKIKYKISDEIIDNPRVAQCWVHFNLELC